MEAKIQSLIDVYKTNRDDLKRTYIQCKFSVKIARKKYYNEAKEIQRFCFDNWKNGKKQREIAEMLGIHTSTVAFHIKNYNRNRKGNEKIQRDIC